MKKHIDIQLSGELKNNVAYRFLSMQAAYKYDIKGIIKYLDKNILFIEAEGEEEKLNEYISWCKSDLAGMGVNDIKTEYNRIIDYKEFDIV